MLALMRKVGAYLHVSTNLHSSQSTTGSCLRDGTLTDGSRKPYFTGRTQNAAYSMTAGLIHRVGNHIDIFEGVGVCTQDHSMATDRQRRRRLAAQREPVT